MILQGLHWIRCITRQEQVLFAGYEMPIYYRSIVSEHNACREKAALFDVSHMGRLRFDGVGSRRY